MALEKNDIYQKHLQETIKFEYGGCFPIHVFIPPHKNNFNVSS